ncbi:hypothetical protein EV199_0355 [Pseudobacter ginsenosidimutans]|uniref:Uncharacterized protein n=1 Tax=Pseudobacter ginsenosidimutans TaxID=661488 RepID=A0A4Q7MZ24_9BACT|nr:hypothetical protein EV199_0355 [Pseudobacter ginsenosidimutans]
MITPCHFALNSYPVSLKTSNQSAVHLYSIANLLIKTEENKHVYIHQKHGLCAM